MKKILLVVFQLCLMAFIVVNANATSFDCSNDSIVCRDRSFFISLDGVGNNTRDSVTLGAGESSTGSYSFSIAFGDIPNSLTAANLNVQFWDLDLFDYDISGVNFRETGVLSSNSVTIATLNEAFAIGKGISSTNNKEISFNFNLFDTFIPPSTLQDPFTLDVLLETHLINNGNKRVTLRNTKECMSAQLSVQPVPEPATMLLLGTGLVGIVGGRLRRKKKA